MFLRRKCRYKDGKAYYSWALVESVRTERGPRQRIVSYLGDMDEAGRVGVHQAVEGDRSAQGSLFGEEKAEWVEVNVRKVRTERSRRFGDVWLALELIKKLGLDKLFSSVMPEIHPKIPWSTLVSVLIISRFCEPSSELHIAESFYRKSAMPDLRLMNFRGFDFLGYAYAALFSTFIYWVLFYTPFEYNSGSKTVVQIILK